MPIPGSRSVIAKATRCDGLAAGTFGSGRELDKPALSRAIGTELARAVWHSIVPGPVRGIAQPGDPPVRSVMPSMSDCAISSRSKGSF
jgi:hypothetical protein